MLDAPFHMVPITDPEKLARAKRQFESHSYDMSDEATAKRRAEARAIIQKLEDAGSVTGEQESSPHSKHRSQAAQVVPPKP